MSDQTSTLLEAPEGADSSMTAIEVDGETHTIATGDAEYELTVHPAFASACTVASNGGAARDLYRQGTEKKDVVNCREKGHPKKHVFKLKGKSNGRDITITIEDPSHSIHSLRLELYKQGRKPGESGEVGEVVMLENNAITCPPVCDPT
jgi:hypothetical protein